MFFILTIVTVPESSHEGADPGPTKGGYPPMIMPAQATLMRFRGAVALNNLGASLLVQGSYKQATAIFKDSLILLHTINGAGTINGDHAKSAGCRETSQREPIIKSGDRDDDDPSQADWIQSKIRMASAMLKLDASGKAADQGGMEPITLNLSTMELLSGYPSINEPSSGQYGSQSATLPTNSFLVTPVRLEIDDFDTLLPNEKTLLGTVVVLFHNIGLGAWCLAQSVNGPSPRTKADVVDAALSRVGAHHGQQPEQVWRYARQFFQLSLSVTDSLKSDEESIGSMQLQVVVLRAIIALSLALEDRGAAEQAASRVKTIMDLLMRYDVDYQRANRDSSFGAGAA